MAEDGGQMGRKVIEKQRHAIAPSLAFGLGAPTRIYLYSQHVRQDGTPDDGLPAVGLQGFSVIAPTVSLATQNTPGIPAYTVADAVAAYKSTRT